MIKLCYKEYDWKITNGACKYFYDESKLDLQTVFGDYISAYMAIPAETNLIDRFQILSRLHPRDIASKALHAIIRSCNASIPLDEIEDATFRVSWPLSDRPDDLSEPWPFIMAAVGFQINDYFNENMPKKKADTSEEQTE